METPLESSTESFLEFNDVYLAFLSVFPFPIIESLTREKTTENLKEKNIMAEWSVPYSRDFEIAEEFLLPNRVTSQYFRIKLGDLELSFVKVLKKGTVNFKLLADVFVTIYPKVGTAILLFNVRLNHCDVDDLIFLQQSLDNNTKLTVVLPPSFENAQKSQMSLKEVAREYINLIFSAFDNNVQNYSILSARCVEIRSLSNFKITNPEELFEKFPKQIYGLLTADEGWRFVPSETAKARMQLKWRTRNFLSVVAFSRCIIFVNFEEKETHRQYKESQKQIREKYGHKAEEYFTFSSEISGLNHGPLFMLENASLQRFIIEQISEQIMERQLRSIKELLIIREKLLDVLAKLSYIKIPEIGLLGQNVQQAMMVSAGVKELKKKLLEIEHTLLIKYNQKINRGIIILTVISLGIGIVTILIETGLLYHLLNAIANLN